MVNKPYPVEAELRGFFLECHKLLSEIVDIAAIARLYANQTVRKTAYHRFPRY